MPLIALDTEHNTLLPRLPYLAAQLGIPIRQKDEQYQYLLRVTPTQLALHCPQNSMAPVTIDFLDAGFLNRIKPGTRNSETLLKLIGKRASTVIDATAGLGRDSFLLAAAGYHVRAYERSPILHALLAEALQHASLDPQTANIAARIHLSWGDSRDCLANESADVVYLDPMHPPRKKKSALVKKEMRILRDLVGDDLDAAALLKVARAHAEQRVVVKLPLHSGFLSDDPPSFSKAGKTTRFDVYCR